MRKRLLSLVLCLALALSLLPTAALAVENDMPFTDVKSTDWFYDAVQYAWEKGMMNGTGDTTFSPNGTTTRGMIVTILHRMEGIPAASGVNFTDVADNAYYANGVAWASANNIVGGYGNGKFGPEDPITREQMATILYRYSEYKAYDVTGSADLSKFTDADKVSDYATSAMAWANAEGLITGITPTTLVPQGNATRAEVATILMRFCENVVTSVAPTIETHVVTFDYNYSNKGVYTTLTAKDGEKISSPQNPTRNGYSFGGWYTTSSGGTKFDFSTPITDDVTLYARWSKNSSGPSAAGYTVVFESNGGSDVESQVVRGGACVDRPDDPQKENCTFIGWYCGNGYSALYDFDDPVDHNITIYAKWFDKNDATDSDGDGLTDTLEKEFGTNPYKADTDDDGVPDYIELNWLNYDPTSSDTDKNGIPDAEEDPDGDGLPNGEEVKYGTNPICRDSDSDCLSDYDEIYKYHTDPLNKDTDSDGVNDGIEIEIGSDPLNAELWFETAMTTADVDENTAVTASAEVVTDAAGAGTLQIDELSPLDNPLLSQSIAGYLGSAYNFSIDGTFKSAEITFRYDTALGEIGTDFQPRIYYFNEETGLLEELPDQIVMDGIVSAKVPHFSTYILLNKVEFDKVWEAEIKAPQEQEDIPYTGIDVVFVIDSSGSMTSNDNAGLRKEAAKAFVDKLGETDRAAVIDFDNYATVFQEFTSDHASLTSAIDRVNSSGGTSLSAGMSKAIEMFITDYTRTDAYKYIIFLTDGDGTYSTSYTTMASDNNIVVYTIGLGSGVKESTLKAIANGTGGKYYFASTADALPDIYAEVSFETVDYTTDSNNDGISDYYTKLLNDGILPLSTGCFDLVDVTEMYGEECDDWDGDGLKNGEEIQVCVAGNKVYVKMESHPLLIDSDGDGYSDATEKKMGTPPMKFTSSAYSALSNLEDDGMYVYIDVANDRGVLASINAFFDWKKTDEAKEQLVSFFYDYASQDTINSNQEKIAELKVREEYLKYAQSLANIAKTAKNVCTIADDVSGMVDGIQDTGDAKNFIDEVKSKKIQIKGASAQIRTSRKQILEAMNTDKLSSKDALKTILTDTDATLSAIEDFGELFQKYDTASFAKDLTSAWVTASSGIASAVGTVKTVYDGFQYIKLDTGFKAISQGYKNFLKTKGSTSTGTYVGAALDALDGGLEIWENCNIYGKMKANRDAYIGYIDLMYYITEHASEEYDRVAAGDIAEIVQDESWKAYEQQLAAANTKTIALTTLAVVADICPYTKVAKSAYDITKLIISVTGLANNAKLIVSCRTMQSVSNGCISIINSNIDTDGNFFSYDSDGVSYMIQLAQCRLVGEDYAKQRLLKGDLAAVISRWIEKTGKDEIEEMFKIISSGIYSAAGRLNLELSDNLPYYSSSYDSGAGGGGVW